MELELLSQRYKPFELAPKIVGEVRIFIKRQYFIGDLFMILTL